jgi:hypothetical protein
MYASNNVVMRPPYLDPETNIRYDTNDSEHEGWLTKQSMWVKVSAAESLICLFVCFNF